MNLIPFQNTCPKCGDKGIVMIFASGKGHSTTPCPIEGEHLHVKCPTCQASWPMRVKELNTQDIVELIMEGLTTDGAHHKQWYLVEIANRLGYSKEYLDSFADFEEGIAP